MFRLIADLEEIYQRQQIAKALFVLDSFNPHKTVFPDQVFQKQFDHYLFLDFNDWFNKSEDYERLQGFCQGIKEPCFFADAPTFYLLNPVQFSADCTHSDFIKGYTYAFEPEVIEHHARNIGLRLSGETFLYGDSLTWAMVHDIIHNFVIVGLEDGIVETFKASFHGLYSDIREVIGKLEAFQSSTMDGAERVISTYA